MSDTHSGVILIIDHEPKCGALPAELQQAGYVVHEAVSAGGGLAILNSNPIDFVISDLHLPDMDGMQLLSRVHTQSPGTQVVLMSTEVSVDSAVEAMKRGARDYVLKPILPSVLLSRIAALGNSSSQTTKMSDGDGKAGAFDDIQVRQSGASKAAVFGTTMSVPSIGQRADGWHTHDAVVGLTETIAGVERSLIDAALRKAAGNQAKAAQFLRIPRTTLRDKMTKYGMVGETGKRNVPQPSEKI